MRLDGLGLFVDDMLTMNRFIEMSNLIEIGSFNKPFDRKKTLAIYFKFTYVYFGTSKA